jgi:hypothetical protein
LGPARLILDLSEKREVEHYKSQPWNRARKKAAALTTALEEFVYEQHLLLTGKCPVAAVTIVSLDEASASCLVAETNLFRPYVIAGFSVFSL